MAWQTEECLLFVNWFFDGRHRGVAMLFHRFCVTRDTQRHLQVVKLRKEKKLLDARCNLLASSSSILHCITLHSLCVDP